MRDLFKLNTVLYLHEKSIPTSKIFLRFGTTIVQVDKKMLQVRTQKNNIPSSQKRSNLKDFFKIGEKNYLS